MRYYAIGDIHGQLQMLETVHDWIAADRARCGDQDAPVVHLGDLVDRGPDSKGVIDFLMQGMARGEPWLVLKGNHDRYLENFYRRGVTVDPNTRTGLDWLNPRLGGDKTLQSYGVAAEEGSDIEPILAQARQLVPQAQIEFIESLPFYHETNHLIFAHAGIRPHVAMHAQTEDDLIWIRDGFLDDDTDHGKIVVHGHTALEAPEHFGNRIDLDSGAGYFRPLTAAVFEDRTCYILSGTTRTELNENPSK